MMTTLNKFVVDAIKTESKIEKVKVHETLLIDTLTTMVHAGNMLDQIKKHVFYGKAYDIDALVSHISELTCTLERLNEIDVNALSTDEVELNVNPRVFHSIVGIATESTELLEALDLYGEALDDINIAEEFGDIDWYKAIGVDELGIDWNIILDTVIKKLKTRYPDKFDASAAITRDLDKERLVLEIMEKNS